MRIVIFSNGSFDHPSMDRQKIEPDDLIIAADGGLHHCLVLGLEPDLLVGDLDSVEEDLIADLRSRGVEIHEHPPRKDHTDLELALEVATRRDPDEILILGGLGGRWDQTLANILLLSQDRFRGPRIKLLDGLQQIELITSGQTVEIHGVPGTVVSLIPIHGTTRGITTKGLEYELIDGTLEYGVTRGVSNVLNSNSASVSVAEGLLVCVTVDAGYESLDA
ncbi:MAG: thiamine diphosphokinase [Anaerolineales bacterium]